MARADRQRNLAPWSSARSSIPSKVVRPRPNMKPCSIYVLSLFELGQILAILPPQPTRSSPSCHVRKVPHDVRFRRSAQPDGWRCPVPVPLCCAILRWPNPARFRPFPARIVSTPVCDGDLHPGPCPGRLCLLDHLHHPRSCRLVLGALSLVGHGRACSLHPDWAIRWTQQGLEGPSSSVPFPTGSDRASFTWDSITQTGRGHSGQLLCPERIRDPHPLERVVWRPCPADGRGRAQLPPPVPCGTRRKLKIPLDATPPLAHPECITDARFIQRWKQCSRSAFGAFPVAPFRMSRSLARPDTFMSLTVRPRHPHMF